nr:di-heme oxidoredictase family protein [Kofleriaceae bacterium]
MWRVAILLGLGACGNITAAAPDAMPAHPSDVPIAGLSAPDLATFERGKAEMAKQYGDSDGLGPLFIAQSCVSCHQDGGRGPGSVDKMVMVGSDGYSTGSDQSELPWGNTVREGLTAGAHTPIVPPMVPGVLVTTRLPPQLLGRGYIEAVDDAEIERVQMDQATRSDAIHGVINHVRYDQTPNPDSTFGTFTQGETHLVGRFGLKARDVVIDEFVAGSYVGTFGLTSPMALVEQVNPDGLTDDDKRGVDLTMDPIDDVVFYVRRVAIPPRTGASDAGAQLFDQVQCSACHVPSLKTRADYPIAQLAGIDAPIYSDLLIHDMGPALADGLTDQSAFSTGWRTTPLIGVRFATAYLHDGRATSVRDAITAHAGEAAAAATAFASLSAADQQTLIDFVSAL